MDGCGISRRGMKKMGRFLLPMQRGIGKSHKPPTQYEVAQSPNLAKEHANTGTVKQRYRDQFCLARVCAGDKREKKHEVFALVGRENGAPTQPAGSLQILHLFSKRKMFENKKQKKNDATGGWRRTNHMDYLVVKSRTTKFGEIDERVSEKGSGESKKVRMAHSSEKVTKANLRGEVP